ncbi:MAG TPA: hypothetical protein VF472_11035 [Burkholderiaceae bacterium]
MFRFNIPEPPVPAELRERLKDYPHIIQEIQDELNKLVSKEHYGTPPFEEATWILQGVLGRYADQARRETRAAEASGDMQAIEAAKQKRLLLGTARNEFWVGDDALWEYFQTNKELFK